VALVLVAGGATGIGRAAVRAFRQRGDRVVLADLNESAARDVAAEDLPGEALAVCCDLGTVEGPAEAVRAAAEFGGGLDIVFANAALLLARPLEEWTVDQWDSTMAVNLRAPFLLAQAALPYLTASACPRLIFTSSTGALRGHAGMPGYHASKAGLVNLARSLADELGPRGITVNTILPGWIDTPFNDSYWKHQKDPAAARDALVRGIPLRRQGTPDDVVGTILYLASAASAYVTGQALVVDGGYSAV